MSEFKLKKIKHFKGRILCKTGMHIGGMNNSMKIGGVDNEIIKHPVTLEPYIPGSSLKGKMRSQLEKKLGKIEIREVTSNGGKKYKTGEPCKCGKADCIVCVLFGAHKNPTANSAPTRIIVRDCFMTEETRKKYNELLLKEGRSFIEQKTENIIDRKLGTASDPRTTERIPSGAEFKYDIVLQVFEGDDEKWLSDSITECLRLVEESYLGGSGSRGYGQVKFIPCEDNECCGE